MFQHQIALGCSQLALSSHSYATSIRLNLASSRRSNLDLLSCSPILATGILTLELRPTAGRVAVVLDEADVGLHRRVHVADPVPAAVLVLLQRAGPEVLDVVGDHRGLTVVGGVFLKGTLLSLHFS